MASNPYVNKVDLANGTTLIDLTADTATQADVAQGKYFHLPTGQRVQGTASGGGGSITQDQDGYLVLSPDGDVPTLITKTITQNGTYDAEDDNADGYSSVTVNVSGGGGSAVYERGTWTPTEDIANAIIPFVNSHSTPPFMYVIADTTSTNASTTADNMVVTYVNYAQYFGSGSIYSTDNATNYALACTRYKGGNNSTGGTSFNITTPYDDPTSGNNGTSQYWATSTGIRFFTNSSGRYARAGRTYSWLAIWNI